MFVIVVRREASIDLDEVFVWYEEQKKNLGFEFIKAFEKIIEKLFHQPHYVSFIDDARSAPLKKFLHKIIYSINEIKQQVRTIAVVYQH